MFKNSHAVKNYVKTKTAEILILFSYLFLPSTSSLSIFFFFLDSAIDSVLEKRLQFSTLSAQMVSIKKSNYSV